MRAHVQAIAVQQVELESTIARHRAVKLHKEPILCAVAFLAAEGSTEGLPLTVALRHRMPTRDKLQPVQQHLDDRR